MADVMFQPMTAGFTHRRVVTGTCRSLSGKAPLLSSRARHLGQSGQSVNLLQFSQAAPFDGLKGLPEIEVGGRKRVAEDCWKVEGGGKWSEGR